MSLSKHQIRRFIPRKSNIQHVAFKNLINPLKRPTGIWFGNRFDWGTNIFELDWDLLILLDACRVDVLEEVACEFEFLNNEISSYYSVGGSTLEWTANTFVNQYIEDISNTVFISNNPWPWRILEEGFRLNEYYENWTPVREDTINQGELLRHVPAWKFGKRSSQDRKQSGSELVRDLAIREGRKGNFDRMIVHFIEPHSPYVAKLKNNPDDELLPSEQNPFGYLRDGGDRTKVWDHYKNELISALNDIESLLQNIDANRVLITADHGEAFGEYGVFGHTAGSFHPHVRKVPLTSCQAIDTNEIAPDITMEANSDINIEERLEHLGYL